MRKWHSVLQSHAFWPKKNVGAANQRLVNKVFTLLINKNMEVYIDGMIIKSKHNDEEGP